MTSISFEGLPAKFSGTNDVDGAEVWSCKFQLTASLKNWSDEQSIKVLQLWLEGSAGIWFYEITSKQEEKPTSLEVWLELLKKKFAVKQEKVFDKEVKDLECLVKHEKDTVPEFNKRFNAVLQRIPIELYTDEMVRRIYLKLIQKLDKMVGYLTDQEYLTAKRTGSVWSLQTLMTAVEAKFESSIPVPSETFVPDTLSDKKPTGTRLEAQMTDLVSNFEKLAMALKDRPTRQDITCWNCGEKGHSLRSCTKPENRELQDKFRKSSTQRYDDARQRSSATSNAMFSTQEQSKPAMAAKRLRIDDLLNNDVEVRSGEPRKPVTKAKLKKKSEKKDGRSELMGRVLDGPAPISLRELIKSLKPAAAQSMVNELRSAIRVSSNKILSVEEEDETQDVAYLLVSVNDQKLPLYVDNGSANSIISLKLVKVLNLEMHPLERVIHLRGISNDRISIEHFTNVPICFDTDVIILVRCLVMKDSAVPFLIGLKSLVKNRAILHYNDQTLSIQVSGKYRAFQLFSKDQLQSMELDSEEEESDADDSDIEDELLLSVEEDKDECAQLTLSVTEEQMKTVPQEAMPLINEFQELFVNDNKEIPGIQEFPYDLKLMPDAQGPLNARLRRFSPKEMVIIESEISKMLDAGVIVPSGSDWSSQIVLVKKKDDSIRFCINFKPLNKITIKDKFPLPRIDDCLDSLAGKKYFSTLDCFSGYWQIPLAKEVQKFTAFTSPLGLFEFTVMPFGLTNAPAHFSRAMHRIFSKHLFNFVTVYLDDIIIYSRTLKEHLEQLRTVFALLRKYRVKLKFKKCQFLCSEFKYLGYWVSELGVQPNPEKVVALVKSDTPTTPKQCRSVVGLANYFRQFIPLFAEIIAPLNELCKKGVKFIWSEACEKSFRLILEYLTSEPVLMLPQLDIDDVRFNLHTDASMVGIGCMLEQYDPSVESFRPIAYYSRKLNSAEKNYPTYEQEALAVVVSIKQFRKYLLGQHFVVFTDNSAVASLYNMKEPSGRIIRWVNALSEYDFDLLHRAGKDNVVADYLSRNVFAALSDPYPITQDMIKDFLTGKICESNQELRRKAKLFVILNDKLYRRSKNGPLLVVTTLEELHEKLKILHDQFGHFAFDTVWNWIKSRFWRKHLYSEVQHYVKSCESCQLFSLRRPQYKFDGTGSISGMFDKWCFDFLGPFPESDSGLIYLCVGIEAASNFPVAIPVRATTAACALQAVTEVFAVFGWPLTIVCDGASSFIASLFRDFCSGTGIEFDQLPPYTPEWNGKVERLNLTIRYALAKMCFDGDNADYSHWDKHIPLILHAIRSRVSSTSGFSPHYLMYGVQPRLPVDPSNSDPPLPMSITARILELESLPADRDALIQESVSSSRCPTFDIGSFVLAIHPSLRKGKPYDKKSPRYQGPFQVVNVHPHNLYEVLSHLDATKVFHASRLVQYLPRYASPTGVNSL